MEKVILTRYLYHLNDVKYSFVSSILKSNDIKEVLFWASEIYYSGFYDVLYNLIWKVYYDFYAIMNPLFESKINKLKKEIANDIVNKMKYLTIPEYNMEIDDNDDENIKLKIIPLDECVYDVESDVENEKYIIYILNILFNIDTINYTVFELRFLNPQNSYKIIKKERNWLILLKKELMKKKMRLSEIEELFLISVYEENENNMVYYLSHIKGNRLDDLYNILKKFYIFVKREKLKDKDNYLNIINYENKHHIILSLICYFQLELKEINKRLVIKKYNKNEYYSYFKNTNNILKIKPYNILKIKRLYGININMGCFLNININNKNKILLNNWEYYSNFSPIWKERFIKYKCIFKNKIPIFANDDLLEEFYKNYGYDPEEQRKEIQLKSTILIKKCNIIKWFGYVFEQEVEISKNIKYIKNY